MGIFNRLFGPPNVDELKAKIDVDGLIKALEYEKDRQVQCDAAKALGKIGDERAVEPLINALKNKDGDVRRESAEALGKIGDERAVEPLIQALVDGTSNVSKEAAEALGNLGNPRALDPLVQALKDKYFVREKAVEALGKIPDVRAIEGLIEVQRYEVRPAVMFTTEVNIKLGAREALKKIGKPAVEPLIRALQDEDRVIREGAAWSLGEIGDERAVTPLIQALKDKHKDVRREAALALRHIGEEATEGLIQALKDEDVEVREAAVAALENKKNERAIEGLIQALKDEDVRREAAEALGRIGNLKTAEEVINTLFDRAYDIARTWSLEENVRKRQNEWKSEFRNLFADYTDLIIDAALFEVRHKHTTDGRYYGYYDYSLNNAEDATKRLCKIYRPITNNILHIIAKRRDIEVRSGEKARAEYSRKTLSFELLRKIAKKELERRGNPPYDSSAYLDEKTWKL